MKKIIWLIALVCLFVVTPVFAAPGGHGGPSGRGFHGGPSMGRPMGGMYRHAGPGMRPMGRPPMARPARPSMVARPVGMPPRHIGHARPLPPPPPVYRRPYRPIIRPYYYSPFYYSLYYPTLYRPTTYTTYYYYPYTNYMTQEAGVTPVAAEVSSVVVKDDYAGVNTAANVINTAANVASTIKYLSW